ncbi:MAG: toxin-antitoxin system YwqK family antitoxin [Bacteroidetes bacterium]|nr:toxin-antitoxin system YwqK family antitoxin [Bacteroidota bacterium]
MVLKQGAWKAFYDNMQIKSEGVWDDDKKNGVFKEYTADGQILKTEVYKNDELLVQQLTEAVKIEVQKQYYANGKIKNSVTIVEGVKQGYSNEYDTAGNILATTVYSDNKILSQGLIDNSGKAQGSWTHYYDDGSAKAKGTYTDGKKTGDWQYFYKGNIIQQSGKYVNGKPHGQWIWKYDNGQILRSENYVNGKEEGQSTEYNEFGKMIAQGNYTSGAKEGLWTFNNGEYIATGMYVDNEQDGMWKTYNADSTLYSEGKYLQGLQQGNFKLYHHNGQIRELQHYKDGIRIGDWKFFDEQGVLLYTITYAGDVIQKIDGVRMRQ